jgi:hypothetical protein
MDPTACISIRNKIVMVERVSPDSRVGELIRDLKSQR